MDSTSITSAIAWVLVDSIAVDMKEGKVTALGEADHVCVATKLRRYTSKMLCLVNFSTHVFMGIKENWKAREIGKPMISYSYAGPCLVPMAS